MVEVYVGQDDEVDGSRLDAGALESFSRLACDLRPLGQRRPGNVGWQPACRCHKAGSAKRWGRQDDLPARLRASTPRMWP